MSAVTKAERSRWFLLVALMYVGAALFLWLFSEMTGPQIAFFVFAMAILTYPLTMLLASFRRWLYRTITGR